MNTDLTPVATQVDNSCDAKVAAELKRLIQTCEAALVNASGSDRVDLNYYIAKANSGLWQIRSETGGPWEWKAHEVTSEISAFRRAIAEPAFERSEQVRQCQIRTNLANNLSTLRRSVDAIEEYSKVLGIDSHFALALGNRAYAIVQHNIPFSVSLVHSYSVILPGVRPKCRASPITHAFRPTGTFARKIEQLVGYPIGTS